MLRQEKVVQLVLFSIIFTEICHRLLEHSLRDLSPLDLAVGLECVFQALSLLRIEALRDFCGRVHMRLKVGGLGQLEHIGVEGGHLRPNIVEQIGLLHVVALDTHWDLVEHLLGIQV